MWTEFWDMHSGGSTKMPPYEKIYIEAESLDAMVVFINRFKRDPLDVYCECCGSDYAVNQRPSLKEATSFHRNEISGSIRAITLEEYVQRSDVLVIPKKNFLRADKLPID